VRLQPQADAQCFLDRMEGRMGRHLDGIVIVEVLSRGRMPLTKNAVIGVRGCGDAANPPGTSEATGSPSIQMQFAPSQ